MSVKYLYDANAPVPPRPTCVEGGGSRADWDEYHRAALLYYHGIEMTVEQVKELYS